MLASVIGLGLALGLAELVLPWPGIVRGSTPLVDVGEPTMHEPDPVLGWRSKPGRYVVPPYQPGARPSSFTFLEGGTRRSAHFLVKGAAGDLVLVGDSYTQGWAISDDETYAWKLQEKRPDLTVSNFGTAGYGTYQALLVLERELPRLARPRVVLYGFLEQHEMRNAAAGRWLEKLSRFSRRGHVAEPFVTLDPSGALVRHTPVSYPELPLRLHSALVTLVGQSWMDLSTRDRVSRARAVTERLLLEMKAVTEARRARLVVVLLHAGPGVRAHYRSFLREQGVQVVDCVRELTSELTVPGEGHPNGVLNTLWAECIAGELGVR